ncbi:MAG: DUF3307 domain-containing protein [Brumimicrobium sp.]
MDVSTLIVLQFIAHLFTDYFLQSDEQAKEKNEKGFQSKFLSKHFLIAFIFSWGLSFQLNFIYFALAIALSHVIIDGAKKYINCHERLGKYAFYIDQLLHISIFTFGSLIFDKYFTLYKPFDIEINWNFVLLTAGYLLCLKPTNIIIKQIFNTVKITDQITGGLENAGRLIGGLERILTLTFVLLGHYEAVGFLIAAKSILRFKEGDRQTTEYVLIGTMLSFSIAIGIGILVLKIYSTT